MISNNSTKKQKNLLLGYQTGFDKLQAQRLRAKLRRDKGSTNLPTPHSFSSLPLEFSFNLFGKICLWFKTLLEFLLFSSLVYALDF